MSKEISEKHCGACSRLLSLAMFTKDRSRKKDGHDSRCRDCRRVEKRDYYQRNRTEIDRKTASYAQSHRQSVRENGRRHKQRNIAEVRRRAAENRRKRYWADPEKGRASSRAFNAKDYAENHARCRERAKRAHVNKVARDPEGVRLNSRLNTAKRRARLRGAESERVDYAYIQRRDRMRCHICKKHIRASDLHFDHVIPVAAGGGHMTNNIAVAHAKCNLTKNAKVITLF